MQLDFKARISRVMYFTLNLLEEIQEYPEEVDSEECRSTVLSLLEEFEDSHPNPETLESVRYALTAWIDDVFSRTPWPHSAYWNAHLLEQELFGTNCRHWRFFEQAEAALLRQDWVALSVFQMCVRCGFRGIYAENRMRVALNDPLPMARSRAHASQSLPLLAGVLREESSGVCSLGDWRTASKVENYSSNSGEARFPSQGDISPRLLPSTLAEWSQTTFCVLGHRDDKPLVEESRVLEFLQRTLPSKRVLTEWAIVMAIGVFLSVVLVALDL